MELFRWYGAWWWLVVTGWIVFGMSSLMVAWQDFRTKRVALWALGIMIGVGSGLLFLRDEVCLHSLEWWLVRGLGALVPAIVLGIAAVQRKAGWGDVVVAFFCGWWVGIFEMAWWLLLSVGLAWGEVGVRFLRRERVSQLPFVTWMTVGFWIWLGQHWLAIVF